VPLDPRITPARPDLAAIGLKGKVNAARFVEGELRQVADAQAPLRRAPSHDAPLDTEALKGERAIVYETNDEGWCWGQLESDKYVGWLPANALIAAGPASTHKVAALRTLCFSAPDIKQPPVETLPLGARVVVLRHDGRFGVTASGYLPAIHLVPVDRAESDFVAVAERFVGTPYLWGGKTSAGIDCSGLVQVALTAAGIICPRDSDMQEQTLGKTMPATDFSQLQRGDLIFWKGHVAIVRDRTTIVHANAHHMAVAIEPIAAAVARIREAGSDVTGVKRIR